MPSKQPPNRIREHRLRRGWGVEELAARLDTTRQTVWKLETGKRQLKPKWLQLLSQAFALPQGAFLVETFGMAESDAGLAYEETAVPRDVAPPLDEAEFFADVQEALRQLYAEERVPISSRELAKAAFDAFAEIVAEHDDQDARDHALGLDLKARRRFIRAHRAELLTQQSAGRRSA